jgi:hypothetical protein
MDTGSTRVAFAVQRNLRSLGNQQSALGCSLPVVEGIQRVRNISRRRRTHARERSQDDAVGKLKVAHLEGGKQKRKRIHESVDVRR